VSDGFSNAPRSRSGVSPERVRRFTGSERAVHWLTTIAFFSLLVSGLIVGRRGTFHDVMYAWHLTSAGVLILGVCLIALVGNRGALRLTARELRRLDAEDQAWLAAVPGRLLHGGPEPPSGRFNGGQKVNFLLVCILFALLLITGIDTIFGGTHHNLIFGAHKLATIGICVLVGGHLYMAVVNRSTRHALRGMLTGEVDRAWAREQHARWEP
jgi:formate dehydrogenase subunit gamma